MIIAPLMRRWGVLVLGGAFLLVGIVVVCTHLSLTSGWSSYAPMSDMAFYPGLPSTRLVLEGEVTAAPDHYASLGGQILIALGITLLAGWVGFALSRRSLSRSALSRSALSRGSLSGSALSRESVSR